MQEKLEDFQCSETARKVQSGCFRMHKNSGLIAEDDDKRVLRKNPRTGIADT